MRRKVFSVEVVFIVAVGLALLLLKPRGRRQADRILRSLQTEAIEKRSPVVPKPTSATAVSRDVIYHGQCWVIDGDTIDIRGTRLRLAGIDAPELDDPYGQVAKFALIRLCKGQVIRAVADGDQSYERLVATCYLPDGRDLSAEMVKAGHAIDWAKFSTGKYRHLEPDGIRKKLWRCDARQKGRAPTRMPD